MSGWPLHSFPYSAQGADRVSEPWTQSSSQHCLDSRSHPHISSITQEDRISVNNVDIGLDYGEYEEPCEHLVGLVLPGQTMADQGWLGMD